MNVGDFVVYLAILATSTMGIGALTMLISGVMTLWVHEMKKNKRKRRRLTPEERAELKGKRNEMKDARDYYNVVTASEFSPQLPDSDRRNKTA